MFAFSYSARQSSFYPNRRIKPALTRVREKCFDMNAILEDGPVSSGRGYGVWEFSNKCIIYAVSLEWFKDIFHAYD